MTKEEAGAGGLYIVMVEVITSSMREICNTLDLVVANVRYRSTSS